MIVWGILTIVFIVIEIIVPSLISIWFSIASFVMMILSFLEMDINYQILIFAIISLILLVVTRPIVKKLLKKEDVIKEKCIVCKKLENGNYEVRYRGVIWRAVSSKDLIVGEEIEITKFDGNKIIL